MAKRKPQHRPYMRKERTVTQTVGANGAKVVTITDPMQEVVLRALNQKWVRTAQRIDGQLAAIKQTAETQMRVLAASKEAELQDFLASCGRVAMSLGINIEDPNFSIQYSEEQNAFVVESKAGESEVPMSDSAPLDDGVEVVDEEAEMAGTGDGDD